MNAWSSSLVVALLGTVAVLVWRIQESRRAVSMRSILIPPLGMATGFCMFLAPPVRVPWTWALGAFAAGAVLLAWPLLKSTRLTREGSAIMMRRSPTFIPVLLGLAALRFALRSYVGAIVTAPQTGGLFFILAFGMIARWRTWLFFEYRRLMDLEPSNPRTFEPSNPRTFEPSNPRTLEPSNPRTLEGILLSLMASDVSTVTATSQQVEAARTALDSWVREVVDWHFDPASGSPFWLDYASKLGWDPRKEIHGYADLHRLGEFQDEWLRGGPVQRWLPRGLAGKPVFVFETGGTTGIPKSRIGCDDFRIDYEIFSETLPDEHFPKGSNWLMLGPSGPRRLRLSVEHLAQYRGGICFCVDLDPRWVIKLIKKGWSEHLQAYKDHVIDQAVTILQAGHDIRCMFTTPKLLESLALRLEEMGTSIRKIGITGIFSGGTEFTPQWNRFAHEELLDGAYMTPTYGNTLMGLAASAPSGPHNNYKIAYYAPQPRAVTEVVDFDDSNKVVEYGQTGRVKLTTLTKEFFMPGFLERDEGEREPPFAKYPWDGVSGVRPYRGFASTTTVGVY